MNRIRIFLGLLLLSMLALTAQAQLPVVIYADTVVAPQGSVINVPVRVKRFNGIYHMTTSITWNPAVLTFNSTNAYGLTNLSAASFSTGSASTGTITLNWFHPISLGQSVPDGTVIFNLNFTIIGTTGTYSRVRFTDVPLQRMWYHWSGNQGALDTIPGLVNTLCATPNVAFTSSATNLGVSFQDNSQVAGTSWHWDFGDGATTTVHNPTHSYAAAGTYVVCFIASNACGSDTVCNTLTVVCNSPTAAFTQASSLLNASFTDQSTSSPTTWAWDFGDGGTATSQNPAHTYAAAGTYNVCLTATNLCGSNTTCHTVAITCPLPVASFGTSPNGLIVTFNNTSVGTISQHWDFGDGATSTASSPTHGYTTPGIYQVCLISTNSCGSDTACMAITVGCPAPVAAFSTTATLLSVLFSDQSTGGATSWVWSFGDGTFSTVQYPIHSFGQAGTYWVCLTVSSPCGSDTLCDSLQVVCPLPSVGFSSQVSGFNATFTDLSSGNNIAWTWDFGDGGTSTVQNPGHTYAQSGTYLVCHNAQNDCGLGVTYCDSITISVVGLADAGLAQVLIHPNPATDALTISLPSSLVDAVELQLSDATGRLVWRGQAAADAVTQVAVGGYARGLYALRVQAASGECVTRRIVLQ